MVQSSKRNTLWWLKLVLCLGAIAVAGMVLALALGATLDPTYSYYAAMSSSLWTTFGPHLVMLALIAAIVGIACWRLGSHRLGLAAIVISLAGVLASTFIVGSIMLAAGAAGGRINPVTGLFLGKMAEPRPDQIATFSNVEGNALTAAIYLPPTPPLVAPVYAYIHGGGFMIGTNTETAADLRWFADRGWVVFSLSYRLFTPDNPTWNKAPVDVACGLAWVYANAETFGGDPERIVLAGDSAGGNLAINLAYGAALGRVRSNCGNVPVPKAVVVQYPAVDPVATYERGFPVPGFEPRMLMMGYVGGTPDEFPERISAISSATYISAEAPPTLVIEPERDGLVVSDSVYAFVEAAKAAGVEVDIVRIPFANHVYDQIASNSIGNQARLTITHEYLRKRNLAP
ncbi:alpha/beta hydrolase [Pararhizobium haloflavum]|uniref:alpha/beta hydrolase n=1 Tax=Pararhizobium haloflavum TaxID=2037914 RepID=UPI000C19B09C|nr:alpha/beta hydrolase [Pararhizobium haloflavum]